MTDPDKLPVPDPDRPESVSGQPSTGIQADPELDALLTEWEAEKQAAQQQQEKLAADLIGLAAEWGVTRLIQEEMTADRLAVGLSPWNGNPVATVPLNRYLSLIKQEAWALEISMRMRGHEREFGELLKRDLDVPRDKLQ